MRKISLKYECLIFSVNSTDTYIYLLHGVGIYPLDSIKEENHASQENTKFAGSRTCSAMRLAMAITELSQVRSVHPVQLPVSCELLHTDLQTFSISSQLASVKIRMQWPFFL